MAESRYRRQIHSQIAGAECALVVAGNSATTVQLMQFCLPRLLLHKRWRSHYQQFRQTAVWISRLQDDFRSDIIALMQITKGAGAI